MDAQNQQKMTTTLTEDEAQLYDRGIRLWGIAAQTRIRAASYLLVGCGALSGEVAKNIVLAGVKRVVFLDDSKLEPADLSAIFLANEDNIGQTVVFFFKIYFIHPFEIFHKT